MARELRRPMSRERALGRAVSGRARPVPGAAADQLRRLEEARGRDEARRRLGVSERTLRRWRAGAQPSRANAERLSREAQINPRREARFRNRGAYVRISGTIGGSPGGRRKNWRHQTIGEGWEPIHLGGDQMGELLDLYYAGEDDAAMEALREAVGDAYGFERIQWDDLTRLEFLRDNPARGEWQEF